MKKNSLLIFFLVFSASLSAQTLFFEKIRGVVQSKDGDVSATHVLNITAKRAAITDAKGFFNIAARLNDTLVFSAVQYKRKEIIITNKILQERFIRVQLEQVLTELDEVVVTPYNLSGDVKKDIVTLKTDPVVTPSTLGLPNAYVVLPTKAERELFEATSGGGIPLNPIINGITGRTKMLKNRVKRNNKYARTNRVREFYADSLYKKELKIPETKIDDFFYYCEIDNQFQTIVDTHDRFKIWEYLRRKSKEYRKNNALK